MKLSKRRHRIKSIRMIERALVEVWGQIEPEALVKLNKPMPKRSQLCLKK
jgi:hypothetical protein